MSVSGWWPLTYDRYDSDVVGEALQALGGGRSREDEL